MRSKEFITEKGPGGGAGSPGPGPGREMTDAQRAQQAYYGEKNLQGFKNWWNNAPQTGAASNMARDPAQLGGQGRPENSMDDSDDFYAKPFVPAAPAAAAAAPAAPAADVPLPQNQRTLRDPNSLNQTAPAAGAAQAGQQGSNYTTGVEQDRPSANNAGVDQTLRGDHPINAPRPGQTVNPVQSPTPRKSYGLRPAILGYASAMGLYKNGQPDIAAIKAFQEKNGLTKDGIIGPDTEGAILSASPSGMTGMGRGGQGGPAAYQKTLPPMPAQQASTPVRPKTTGPVSTGRQPWEHTPPAPDPVQVATPVPAPINRGTNTKYKNPPDSGATPAATKEPIYRGSESGKNYVNPDQPRGAHPTNMSYDKNGKALFPMPSPFANQNAAAATQAAQPAATATVPAYPTSPYDEYINASTFDKLRGAFGSGPLDRYTRDEKYNAYAAALDDWEAKYGKTHNKDGTPKRVQETVVKESSDLARIRHLAGLNKG
jgi:hypothetical protein